MPLINPTQGGGGGGTPATTVVSSTSFSQAPAVGSSLLYARADHVHGTPANPGGGGGGAVFFSDTLIAPLALDSPLNIPIPEGIFDIEINVALLTDITTNSRFVLNSDASAEYNYVRGKITNIISANENEDMTSATFISTSSDTTGFPVLNRIRLYQPVQTGPVYFKIETFAGGGLYGVTSGVFRNSAAVALTEIDLIPSNGDAWPVGTKIEARSLR